MKIEINHKLLSDSPLNEENKALFTAVVNIATNDLIEDIIYGNPTCYLLSGYRGSGKSSFIKKIQSEIKSLNLKSGKEPVFVYTNFSKYKDQSSLLRKLIRALYLEINDFESFREMKSKERKTPLLNRKALLLEELYDKTFYDTSHQNSESKKRERVTVFNIDIVELLKFLVPLVATFFFILNWIHSWLNLTDTFDFLCAFGSMVLSARGIFKLTHNITQSKVSQREFVRKSLFDNEIADYHLLTILSFLQSQYKIVFVLDELDKISDTDIDTLLNEMKPYFVSGAASFIVVAGQSLFYKYSEARTIDDALLSSIFSKFIHIPLFSRIELQGLFKSILIQNQVLSHDVEELISNYVDYLIFESKKVPRKFISLVRQNLVWENGKSYLFTDESSVFPGVYTIINNIVDKIANEEIATQVADGPVRDYCMMQLYLKTHSILAVKKDQFTFDEIINQGDKDNNIPKWTDNLTPVLDSYFKSLFSQLEEDKLIMQSSQNGSVIYRLTNKELISSTTTTTTTLSPLSSQNAVFRTLFDLRNIAKAVYQNLDYPDSKESYQFPLGKIFSKLEENKAFTVRWNNKPEVMDIFDKLDVLANDSSIEKGIEIKLTENNINPNTIIVELLEFYGQQKAAYHFTKSVSNDVSKVKTEAIDWILLNHPNVGNLCLNFKLRRTDPVPDKESLLQAIRQLESTNNTTFVLLVVFTYENTGSFDKLKFQFRQILLNDLREHNAFVDKIKFMPVSTTAMNLLDNEFNEFKKSFVEDHFSFIFKNQPTPRGFPNRNDHFLEKVFDIRKTNITILVQPAQTKYWRLGFRFIQSETFPPLTQERHVNEDVGDIHICVGDAETENDGSRKWIAPNQLTITEYHVDLLQNDFRSLQNYQGSPVTLSLVSKNGAATVEISILINNEPIGKKTYNLQKFKYCRLSAWCDQADFELKTDIQLIYSNT